MSKLIIDLDAPENVFGLAYYVFKSKEDYESDPFSGQGKDGLRYDWAPSKFPCLMFDCGRVYNPNGADEIKTLYIYDFEIRED